MTHFPAVPLRPSRPSWIETLFLIIVATIIEVPFRGFAVMILFGVLHHEVASAVPPIGFGLSALLGVLVSVVLSSSSDWTER